MSEWPDTAIISLPEPYITAIGRVCIQSSMLETAVEILIRKLGGFEMTGPMPSIFTIHMSWPQRLDALGTLISLQEDEHPHLRRYYDFLPSLRKAQANRSRIIHAQWHYENGEVFMLRATARGRLKGEVTPVSLDEILAIADEIGSASINLWRIIMNK